MLLLIVMPPLYEVTTTTPWPVDADSYDSSYGDEIMAGR